MKKVLFVNWLPTGSTSLSLRISAHSIDTIATAKAFQKKGYEVWLHEAYVIQSKQSDWPNKIKRSEIQDNINQFDIVVVPGLPQTFWDYLFAYYPGEKDIEGSRGNDLTKTIDALYSFTGRILTLLYDPRDTFITATTCHHPKTLRCDSETIRKITSIFERTEIVTPIPILDILNASSISDIVRKEVLSRKNILCNYNFHQSSCYPLTTLRDTYQYETVYVGMGSQTKERKRMIKDMISKHHDVYTAGPIFLKNIPNLTSIERDSKKRLIISKDEVLKLTRNSRVSILVSEPGHINWPTPRMYECLIGGTIPAIHPSFPSASLILRTFKRCAVDHIRDIPYDRSWEEDTYAIAKEEVDNLSKLRPLDIEL